MCADIELQTSDGLTLPGWCYRALENASPLIVMGVAFGAWANYVYVCTVDAQAVVANRPNLNVYHSA